MVLWGVRFLVSEVPLYKDCVSQNDPFLKSHERQMCSRRKVMRSRLGGRSKDGLSCIQRCGADKFKDYACRDPYSNFRADTDAVEVVLLQRPKP